jgi:hypothetical protein
MSDNPSEGGRGDKTNTNADNKTIDARTTQQPQSTKSEMDPTNTTTNSASITPTTSSPFDAKQQLDRALNTAATQISHTGQKIVHSVGHALNVGDQLAVYGIIILVVTLLAAPVVIQGIKNSKRKDYFTGPGDFTGQDPIDDFAQLARIEWDKANKQRHKNRTKTGGSGGGNDESNTSKGSSNDTTDDDDDDEEYQQHSTMEKMLKDLISSKALQQAAQQFVVTILEADEFKTALRKLVQELWNDLLRDPETLAQVIYVLQVAIKDEKVQKAVQELVVDLVAEPQVQQALIQVLQRLGAERQVLQATQALLTNAAHQSLADPEILEHSMEFATDVLGDDIVQQSAGEALRNSVGHAIGHSLFNPNTILTVVGVGFFLVGMIALGNVSTTSSSTAATAATAATAMVTSALGGRGGGGTEISSSNRSVVAAAAIGGTTSAAAAAAAATTVTSTPVLQRVWDMAWTVMATIVHALIVSPICYLGRGLAQAATCTGHAAYQHLVVPPIAATASIWRQFWQWTGQELMAVFVTPSSALLARLINAVNEGRVDLLRCSNRMWIDLNDVVAVTVDTAWTAIYTNIASCCQWILSQPSRVRVVARHGMMQTTITLSESVVIRSIGAWSVTVLDQSRQFMTLSVQYLARTSTQVARVFQEWFILAVS